MSLLPFNGVPYEFLIVLVELFDAGGIGRNDGEGTIVSGLFCCGWVGWL
tara:strand:+ start:345 stop:491 length:147 start_codon:yes stop_codon:yes gene_type:complete